MLRRAMRRGGFSAEDRRFLAGALLSDTATRSRRAAVSLADPPIVLPPEAPLPRAAGRRLAPRGRETRPDVSSSADYLTACETNRLPGGDELLRADT